MATWNRAHFIEEALRSIYNQSYKNWECLIIDDGSIDNTGEVVQKLIEKDHRFKYFKRTGKYKKGLPGSRNMGLDLAQGDNIIFFDDDDIIHPENLRLCQEILEKNSADFCRYEKKPFFEKKENFTFSKITHLNLKEFTAADIEKMVIGEIPFASCNVMWDSKALKHERFNESLMYAEEWEFYSRVLSRGLNGFSINQVLYYNRKHLESNTGEYHLNNPVQVQSKKDASLLIIQNLSSKNMLNPIIKKFFLRLGYGLHSFEIIRLILKETRASKLDILKYKLGFIFYPILRPMFILKARLKMI